MQLINHDAGGGRMHTRGRGPLSGPGFTAVIVVGWAELVELAIDSKWIKSHSA